MPPVASLPMYDWPEFTEAHRHFWDAVRTALIKNGEAAPEQLQRPDDIIKHWKSTALFFSQTCGWPYATGLRDHVALVGTPTYASEGCANGTYSSAIIVHQDAQANILADLRGGCVAYNGPDSQSGVHALRHLLSNLGEAQPFFKFGLRTGAHRASIKAVATKRASCAAIDAHSFAMAQKVEPSAQMVRILTWTAPAPALPFITSRANAAKARGLLDALRTALAAGAGEPLGILDIAEPDESAYLELPARVSGAPNLYPDFSEQE